MRFLVDAQLPPALTRMLKASGHPVEHVFDLHLQNDSGPRIVWNRWGNVRRQMLLDRFARSLPAILIALDAGEAIVELAEA